MIWKLLKPRDYLIWNTRLRWRGLRFRRRTHSPPMSLRASMSMSTLRLLCPRSWKEKRMAYLLKESWCMSMTQVCLPIRQVEQRAWLKSMKASPTRSSLIPNKALSPATTTPNPQKASRQRKLAWSWNLTHRSVRFWRRSTKKIEPNNSSLSIHHWSLGSTSYPIRRLPLNKRIRYKFQEFHNMIPNTQMNYTRFPT